MKRILLLLCFLLLSCQEKKEVPTSLTDFESLMGKGLPAWEHVVTPQDFEHLEFFKKLYEKNISLLTKAGNQEKIPKVLHFIWVGPHPFPRESVINICTWIEKNPGWAVYFWTDRERGAPHPLMQTKRIQELEIGKLTPFYDRTNNYGEKADLLRYQILYTMGGVYVDHDVKCLKSFEAMTAAYDLFCGLEVPFKTPLSSSIFPTNNLIGARPFHPIIAACMDKVAERWERIEKQYTDHDLDSEIKKVAFRTFSAFGEAFKEGAGLDQHEDIAFPAFFFNAPKETSSLYARHLYKGTWFENETKFEKNTRERLMYVSKKVNKILLACSIMTLINTMGFVLVFIFVRKRMY